MEKVKCLRIYADAQGESHFGEAEVELNPTDYIPPAPPLRVSQPFPATQYVLASAPAQWFGDWHPYPCRQLAVYLSGRVDLQTSDGEIKHIAPGDFVLMEDTTGKGHRGRTVHGALVLFVHLAD